MYAKRVAAAWRRTLVVPGPAPPGPPIRLGRSGIGTRGRPALKSRLTCLFIHGKERN